MIRLPDIKRLGDTISRSGVYGYTADQMREYAEIVRADEREAILDLVDSYAKNNTDLADAIRARGNT